MKYSCNFEVPCKFSCKTNINCYKNSKVLFLGPLNVCSCHKAFFF